MPECVWYATLSAAELAPWLEPPRSDSRYAILECMTAIDFPGPDQVIDPEAWEQGRIFDESFELRWERAEDRYRVWLSGVLAEPSIDEKRRLPEARQVDFLADTSMESTSCYLWGRDEVRVAHAPVYRSLPEKAGRVQLALRSFRSADGSLVYSRYAGMTVENIR